MKPVQSLDMQERAKKRIPGMTQLLSKRPDMFAAGYWPGYYEKAKGVEVWDLDGNRYVDMSIGGIGANVLGYADPDVNSAVLAAVEKGSSSSLNCPEEVELADLLCEIHPWAEQVRYARSGGEAMAIAVRIARAKTGRDTVAFCGYHGWHDWYLAANLAEKNALGDHLLPGLSPVGVPSALKGTAIPFHYNQLEELEDIVRRTGGKLAAIVMEPIRSESPTSDFIRGVRSAADDVGAVLVVDEISAGFRITTGGAHLALGLDPDMAVFSKAMGNGFPIAAIIGKETAMGAAQSTFISSTMFTERIGPCAALATVEKFRRTDASTHLMTIGEKIQKGWRAAAESSGLEIKVGGLAPLSHFVFDHPEALTLKALFVKWMLMEGFLASNLFYAMLPHNDAHVSGYLEAVGRVFTKIAQASDSGSLDSLLDGPPSTAGFKRIA